jgi:hypothetical protein
MAAPLAARYFRFRFKTDSSWSFLGPVRLSRFTFWNEVLKPFYNDGFVSTSPLVDGFSFNLTDGDDNSYAEFPYKDDEYQWIQIEFYEPRTVCFLTPVFHSSSSQLTWKNTTSEPGYFEYSNDGTNWTLLATNPATPASIVMDPCGLNDVQFDWVGLGGGSLGGVYDSTTEHRFWRVVFCGCSAATFAGQIALSDLTLRELPNEAPFRTSYTVSSFTPGHGADELVDGGPQYQDTYWTTPYAPNPLHFVKMDVLQARVLRVFTFRARDSLGPNDHPELDAPQGYIIQSSANGQDGGTWINRYSHRRWGERLFSDGTDPGWAAGQLRVIYYALSLPPATAARRRHPTYTP